MAINLFLLGLIGAWIGLPPLWAPRAALPLSRPATRAARVWVQGLIDEAGT